MSALPQGRTDVARLLMERGARPDALDISNRSPLALAAAAGYVDCVQLLLLASATKRVLDEPAITTCIDTRGRTPLLFAASRGHSAVRQSTNEVSRLGSGSGMVRFM